MSAVIISFVSFMTTAFIVYPISIVWAILDHLPLLLTLPSPIITAFPPSPPKPKARISSRPSRNTKAEDTDIETRYVILGVLNDTPEEFSVLTIFRRRTAVYVEYALTILVFEPRSASLPQSSRSLQSGGSTSTPLLLQSLDPPLPTVSGTPSTSPSLPPSRAASPLPSPAVLVPSPLAPSLGLEVPPTDAKASQAPALTPTPSSNRRTQREAKLIKSH